MGQIPDLALFSRVFQKIMSNKKFVHKKDISAERGGPGERKDE
jgi:hypothetical protein